MRYYKVLEKGGVSCNGGNCEWKLPKGEEPGAWMPKIDNIIPCKKGYHLCRTEDIIFWLDEEIYTAEGRGEFIRHDNNKDVFQQARLIRKIVTWNKKNARFFAADCAEHVLEIFEREFPFDKRPRLAIEVARSSASEFSVVAWAAEAAAGEAEAAARAAAGEARAAARAAEAAERQWQTSKLMEYLDL
ncbi:MAG: hypothetical protein DDT33_00987 [Firmicutes bacterium]|nr:hypothetical protein [Bacillota bacterium]